LWHLTVVTVLSLISNRIPHLQFLRLKSIHLFNQKAFRKVAQAMRFSMIRRVFT